MTERDHPPRTSRRGRPRLHRLKVRSERVLVQASLLELAELRAGAARVGVPLAVFVRAAALFAATNLSAAALGLGHEEVSLVPRED